MESKNATATIFQAREKRRPYGKAPLDLDLLGALEAVSKIAQEGKSMPQSKLALILGNTVTSSAFTRKIRALSGYGLLMDLADGQFGLTDLALSIALPRSSQSQTEAKKQAFLRIEQFNFLFNQHKGKLLPADEFLRNILEQECSVPRDLSQVWVRQFKDGARAAGLFHSRADGKVQISESPVSVETVSAPHESIEKSKSTPGPVVSNGDHSYAVSSIEPTAPALNVASGHCTRIDLSDGRRAEISIPDRLSARDAQKLQKALDGVKVIIESMVSED